MVEESKYDSHSFIAQLLKNWSFLGALSILLSFLSFSESTVFCHPLLIMKFCLMILLRISATFCLLELGFPRAQILGCLLIWFRSISWQGAAGSLSLAYSASGAFIISCFSPCKWRGRILLGLHTGLLNLQQSNGFHHQKRIRYLFLLSCASSLAENPLQNYWKNQWKCDSNHNFFRWIWMFCRHQQFWTFLWLRWDAWFYFSFLGFHLI